MIRRKPCIKITLTDTKPSIFDSKVGGLGYIPHDEDFPRDSDGNQLRLLAQIDCSQVDCDLFPKVGLLQFWILNNSLYGCDEPTNQDKFRVLYYSELDRTVTEEEVASKFVTSPYDEENLFPVDRECGMLFSFGESLHSPDYWDAPKEELEEFDSLHDYDAVYHQIGGYPYFTQYDPRSEDSPYDFLLFQLDSDYGNHHDRVLWGDAGIGNFFIQSENLRNLDFSDVWYNWDCC